MQLIKKANWPLIVFVLLGVVAAINPSFSLAASALVLGLYVGYDKFLTDKAQSAESVSEQAALKAQVTEMSGKVAEMNNYVSGVTLKQTIAAASEKRRFF